MSNTEVVICSPVRTAIGTYGGTLKDMPAADLGVPFKADCPSSNAWVRKERH